jgi:hypothetical protein
MALLPGVGLGLHYNTYPSLLIPCSISPFVYSHLSQVRRHIIQPSRQNIHSVGCYYIHEIYRLSTVRLESRCALKLQYSAMYRDHPRNLNGLKSAITAYIRNISQADLQKVFVNKIKQIQACIVFRGHNFYNCTVTS